VSCVRLDHVTLTQDFFLLTVSCVNCYFRHGQSKPPFCNTQSSRYKPPWKTDSPPLCCGSQQKMSPLSTMALSWPFFYNTRLDYGMLFPPLPKCLLYDYSCLLLYLSRYFIRSRCSSLFSKLYM